MSETYKYYHYEPSFPAAIIMAVVFGLSTTWHGFLIAKHRTWYFIPLVIGGTFELVGYAARGASNKEAPNPTIGPFVVQTLLLLLAPALLAASIYMVLGRIIMSVDGESCSLIKIRWLTKIFVTSDAVTFIVQLAGGGLMASTTASTATLGSRIILSGLVLQIIIFGFFVAVSVVFHIRLRATPTKQSRDRSSSWEKFMIILYTTSGFIMIRSIVRVAEFVGGFDGFIILHEVFLYVLDAVPMLAVMLIFNVVYPSSYSTRARKAAAHRASPGDSSVELGDVEV